jgi:hypothetical protein
MASPQQVFCWLSRYYVRYRTYGKISLTYTRLTHTHVCEGAYMCETFSTLNAPYSSRSFKKSPSCLASECGARALVTYAGVGANALRASTV